MRRSVVAGLLMITACEEAPREAQTPAPARPDIARPTPSAKQEDPLAWERDVVLPVDPRHRKLALTRSWLAGYWVGNKGACFGSDSGIALEADGSYSNHETEGRYAIAGDVIRLTVTSAHNAPPEEIGTSQQFRARLIGPNEMGTDWGGGETETLYRCPASGMDPAQLSRSSPSSSASRITWLSAPAMMPAGSAIRPTPMIASVPAATLPPGVVGNTSP